MKRTQLATAVFTLAMCLSGLVAQQATTPMATTGSLEDAQAWVKETRQTFVARQIPETFSQYLLACRRRRDLQHSELLSPETGRAAAKACGCYDTVSAYGNTSTVETVAQAPYTMFTTIKPNTDPHIRKTQRIALRSWTLLRPRPEIILFGNEAGNKELAAELGLRYVPHVPRNAYGTPMMRPMFEKAERMAKTDTLVFINGDIVLTGEFSAAMLLVDTMPLGKRLLVGQRTNIEVDHVEPLRMDTDSSWTQRLLERVGAHGQLAEETYVDYFVFSKGLWAAANQPASRKNKRLAFPPIAIGRWKWDNFLVHSAMVEHDATIVDLTGAVVATHLNHDYSHMRKEPLRKPKDGKRVASEQDHNTDLTRGRVSAGSTTSAMWKVLLATNTGRPGICVCLVPNQDENFRLISK